MAARAGNSFPPTESLVKKFINFPPPRDGSYVIKNKRPSKRSHFQICIFSVTELNFLAAEGGKYCRTVGDNVIRGFNLQAERAEYQSQP
jgi:hypothetical protein